MRNQNGFTLIELVVVIVILGILAAVAVPKFVDMQEDAKKAAVEGAAGALNSGVAMTKAKWLIGNTGAAGDVTIDTGVVVGVNASGWAVGGTGVTAFTDATTCEAVWDQIMTSNSMTAGAGEDFTVGVADPVCQYTYSGSTYRVDYNTTTGAVVAVFP